MKLWLLTVIWSVQAHIDFIDSYFASNLNSLVGHYGPYADYT